MKRTLPLIAFVAPLLAGGAALAAPLPESGWGLPRDVSLEGWRIDHLLKSTAVLTGILFVIMVFIMVKAMTAHREGKHKAQYEHGVGRHHVMVAIAISSAIFFIVDGNLYVNAMMDLGSFWKHADPDAEKDALKVEVNAQQWAWNFRYAGPDGQFNTADDIVTTNELKVPVDRPVVLQLASKDVIHSLYLPNLRIKQDAVPGNITHMWFQATKTGDFDIACAQHCGTHHYKMKGELTVLGADDFKKWSDFHVAISKRGFDESDKAAQWGWRWESI